jgi:glycosyltransferase involved in cell wall biosynthesis
VHRAYGFLSTYPPTRCGAATFTFGLARALARPGSGETVGVVRVHGTSITSSPPEVVEHLRARAPGGYRAAATALNTFDVAIVAVEEGIYGGQAGDQLLSVLDEVRVPVVLLAHSIPSVPSMLRRGVLERAMESSAAVVTTTRAACERLVTGYAMDAGKVVVIPRGSSWRPAPDPRPPTRPVILTWGLLRPGKGVELAIDGLQRLRNLQPLPVYIVAGQTHPRTREEQGEAYRHHLERRVDHAGVARLVRFVDAYLDDVALSRFIARAEAVALPYDPPEPVASAVLVEAIAAGKPVGATTFPHAVELLSDGAGILIPQQDSAAIGEALHRILTEPDHRDAMAARATQLARGLSWPAVAARYRSLASAVLSGQRRFLAEDAGRSPVGPPPSNPPAHHDSRRQ